jgi:hypothetical protein
MSCSGSSALDFAAEAAAKNISMALKTRPSLDWFEIYCDG